MGGGGHEMLMNADKGGGGGIEMLTSGKNAKYYLIPSKKQSEIPNKEYVPIHIEIA